MKKILLTIGILVVAVAIIFTGVMLIQAKTYTPKNPIATVQIEGYDKPIKLELDPQSAPNAVANFVKLANNGFYTDFKMSIEKDRILGDESMEKAKLSNIMEYPQNDYTYGIKGDFIANGNDKNLIKHKKGIITMERDDYSYLGFTEEGYNSANCNFCILTEDKDEYNGRYAAFGKVVEGIDVLDAIAATRVEKESNTEDDNTEQSATEKTSSTEETTAEENEDKKEENTITIKSITVDTFGIEYGTPEFVNYEENYKKVNEVYSQYFGGNSNNSSVVESTEDVDSNAATVESTSDDSNATADNSAQETTEN